MIDPEIEMLEILKELRQDQKQTKEMVSKPLPGDSAVQFIGGGIVAAKHELTGHVTKQPDTFRCQTRKELNDIMNWYSNDFISQFSKKQTNLHKNQNNMQDKLIQPLSKEGAFALQKHVISHEVLDRLFFDEFGKLAPNTLHHALDIKMHQKVDDAFNRGGQPAGHYLHQVAIRYSSTKYTMSDMFSKLSIFSSSPEKEKGLEDPKVESIFNFTLEITDSMCYSNKNMRELAQHDRKPSTISKMDL